MAKNTSTNRKSNSRILKETLQQFLYSIPLVIFLILAILSRNNEFFSSFTGSILINSTLFIFFIAVIFIRKKQLHFLVSLYLLISSFLLCYLSFLIPFRCFILVTLLLSLSGFIFHLFPKKFETEITFTFIFSLVLLLPTLFITNKATLINEGIFFLVAIPLSLVIGSIIVFLYLKKHKKVLSDKKEKIIKKERNKQNVILTFTSIGIYLLTYIFSFIGVTSLNYVLDFNEPKIIKVEVLDKKTSRLLKRRTFHKIKINYEDKNYEVNLPFNVYKEIKVGDLIELNYSSGLFNSPYIIHPNYS